MIDRMHRRIGFAFAPVNTGDREVIDFLCQRIISRDLQRPLHLRQDDTKMRNRNDMLPCMPSTDCVYRCLNPGGCGVPAFAAGCGNVAGHFPELSAECRISRCDVVKMHAVPDPEVNLSQMRVLWQPFVRRMDNGICGGA